MLDVLTIIRHDISASTNIYSPQTPQHPGVGGLKAVEDLEERAQGEDFGCEGDYCCVFLQQKKGKVLALMLRTWETRFRVDVEI